MKSHKVRIRGKLMNNEAFYADKIVELTRLIEDEQLKKFTTRLSHGKWTRPTDALRT